MASSPKKQEQTQEERDQIKLGQEQTQRARTKSAPLLADYQKKMNRDDSARLGGMSAADVAQSAGTDSTGQQLASGKAGGHTKTGLGGQISQATNNGSTVALGRQDGMKSNYGALGNKKNMNAVASLKASSAAASEVASADAYASSTRQNAMMDSAITLGATKGLLMHDKYETAGMPLKKALKDPSKQGFGSMHELATLRREQMKVPGAKIFNKLGSW